MSYLLEVTRLGLGNLRRHKLRSVLTSLGVILGVAAVIVVVAIGEGNKRAALRDISALTVCVPMELVPQLKQRIQGFREVLLDLCDRATPGEAVYQINMQLFPLSLSDPKKP